MSTNRSLCPVNATDSRTLCPTGHLSPSVVTEISNARKRWADRRPKDAPSILGVPSNYFDAQISSGEPVWCFNRPPEAGAATPVTLLHPIFGKFLDDCKTHCPNESDNQLVLELSIKMSKYYATEEKRMSEFRAIMERYGIVLGASTIEGTNYRTDGHLRIGERVILLVEGKNEIGSTGAEPIFQGLAYYSSVVSDPASRPSDRFPLFLIFVVGELLQVP